MNITGAMFLILAFLGVLFCENIVVKCIFCGAIGFVLGASFILLGIKEALDRGIITKGKDS